MSASAASATNEDDEDEDENEEHTATTSSNVAPSLQPFCYDDQHHSAEFARSTAKMFSLSAKSRPNLFAMAISTVESFPTLTKRPPFSKLKKRQYRKDFILVKDHLVAEIASRSHFIGLGEWKIFVDRGEAHPFGDRRLKPRPGKWSMDVLIAWLEKYKIKTNHRDLLFLKKQMEDYTNYVRELVMSQNADMSSDHQGAE